MLMFEDEFGQQSLLVFVTDGKSAALENKNRNQGQRKGGACISIELAGSSMVSLSSYPSLLFYCQLL